MCFVSVFHSSLYHVTAFMLIIFQILCLHVSLYVKYCVYLQSFVSNSFSKRCLSNLMLSTQFKHNFQTVTHVLWQTCSWHGFVKLKSRDDKIVTSVCL